MSDKQLPWEQGAIYLLELRRYEDVLTLCEQVLAQILPMRLPGRRRVMPSTASIATRRHSSPASAR